MTLSSHKLLIHIGYHKTATTWLQTELFDRSDRGFFPFPHRHQPFGRPSKQIARRILKLDDGYYCSDLLFDRNRLFNQLIAEFDSTGSGIPVISNERLSGNPFTSGFDSAQIADRLHALFPQARVMIVIREQVESILSGYFEYLISGGTLGLRRYLKQPYDYKIPLFSPHHYAYDRLIAHYQSLFSPSRVLVLPFEMFKQEPYDFLLHLHRFSGATMPPQLPVTRRANAGSMRLVRYYTRALNMLAYKRALNGYSPLYIAGAKQTLSMLQSILNKLVPARFKQQFIQRTRHEVRQSLTLDYAESNRRTSELIGIDLAVYNYAYPAAVGQAK